MGEHIILAFNFDHCVFLATYIINSYNESVVSSVER